MADGSLISQATRDKRKHATCTLVTAAIVELVRVAVGNGRSVRGRQQPVEGEKPFWKRDRKKGAESAPSFIRLATTLEAQVDSGR